MSRLVAGAVLAAVVLVAVPVLPANACSMPIPAIDLDRDRVARGGRVTVSDTETARADGTVPTCVTPTPPPASPTESPVAVAPSPEEPETASPSPSESLISLPPLRPVAFVAARPVTVTIEEYRDWDQPSAKGRTLATVAAGSRVPFQNDLYTWSFEARVTIPRDVTPGRYVLRAFEKGAVYYGEARITVTNDLASTGPNRYVTAFGLLLLGGAALLVRQQQAHRLSAGGHAVAERPAHR